MNLILTNIDANLIDTVITKKTKAIIPVSFYGQPADMGSIQTIVHKYNLKVIIDDAQSFGSTYNNKTESIHPTNSYVAIVQKSKFIFSGHDDKSSGGISNRFYLNLCYV